MPAPQLNLWSVPELVDGYQPLSGVHDEMVDARGQLRPHWKPLLESFAAMGVDEMRRRFSASDRYLRDAGVFYRVYEGSTDERPWPLAHVPLLIPSAEWKALERGLVQRARLLEAVLSDVYGTQRLIGDGNLPAPLVAGSQEFLRSMVGTRPRGDRFLWFYGVDLGRAPDGRWWVLGDRAQAPSGAGYAIENRVAMTRALPDVSRGMNVERLAGFFQSFRSALGALTGSDSARVALLTPGAMNETYFEHAYLARYLGFLLVEGGDLTVRRDELYVRTVTGLKRIHALWRRLDAQFADPLELNGESRIGVPGLARAVRRGSVAVANALGSGLAEARGFLAFWPSLCESVLGQPLEVPNIATWWCGQPSARDEVIERLDEMAIASAFAPSAGGIGDAPTVLGSDLDSKERAQMIDRLRRRGVDHVGQEVVHLSTTPVWNGERLEPHPCVIRVYLARTEEGWTVMPGAFCRISENDDARAISMQRGGMSSDVWIVADKRPADITLLPPADSQSVKRVPGSLPSRAADNLFWMGRYVERAEGVLRLLRAYAVRAGDVAAAGDPVLSEIEKDLAATGGIGVDSAEFGPASVIASAFSLPQPASLAGIVASAVGAASRIRDRLSPDAFLALRDLDLLVRQVGGAGPAEGEAIERIGAALRIVSAFAGLTHENLNRLSGWRFLMLGRRIERAQSMTRLVARFARADAAPGCLDALLELGDSVISYRQRYTIATAHSPVVDLVMLDPNNPRSVAYQMSRITELVSRLPGRTAGDVPGPMQIIGVRLGADLSTTPAGEIDAAFLDTTLRSLRELSDAIGAAFFSDRGLPTNDWELS